MPGDGGCFEVALDGKPLFSKLALKRFPEAGEVLKEKCPNINFVYLPTRMNGHQPEYTYTLERGITGDRHGMVIINNEKILDILRNGNKKSQKATAHEFHNG